MAALPKFSSTTAGASRAKPGRLIVVANRLPVRRVVEDGVARWVRADGGLVSALLPLLQRQQPASSRTKKSRGGASASSGGRGAWIGWPGIAEDAVLDDDSGGKGSGGGGGVGHMRTIEQEGVRLHPIHLSHQEIEDYYDRMSNRTFWPLYHDAIRVPEFRHEWWEPYVQVNARFARLTARVAKPRDCVWVHDYHLQLVPAMLRRLRPDVRIGFFLHIPFPPEELFAWLPWRKQILEGLMGADVVGFQTASSAQNFARACRNFTAAEGSGFTIDFEGRQIMSAAFPISIDFDRYAKAARSPKVHEITRMIRSRVGSERKILLGIDRLDYTKGIDARLLGFEHMLQRGREADVRRSGRGRKTGKTVNDCVLIQVAVPSRDPVPEYQQMREDIERHVGRINGSFGEAGRVAVHYLRRNLSPDELIAYYQAADVMVVTPFRDGMNLVAKEYVATRSDNTGVLVLSEFAGASSELKRALLVNPRDIRGVSESLTAALDMPASEASRRMSALRTVVRRHDVHDWAQSFMEALGA